MAPEISYNKKQYRNVERIISKGKFRHSANQAIISMIFQIPLLLFVLFFVDSEENSYMMSEKIILILIMFFISFFPFYFLHRWNFRHIKKLYENSRDYWEKHDPSFFEETDKKQKIK